MIILGIGIDIFFIGALVYFVSSWIQSFQLLQCCHLKFVLNILILSLLSYFVARYPSISRTDVSYMFTM